MDLALILKAKMTTLSRMVRKTRKVQGRDANTLTGLEEWSNAMFEKLGGMVLAKDMGRKGKVSLYKTSVRRLLASIQHAKGEYYNMDRIHDLRVLEADVKVLDSFVQKHL